EFNRVLCGLLPGFRAGADDFDDFIDTLGHGDSALEAKERAATGGAHTPLGAAHPTRLRRRLSRPRFTSYQLLDFRAGVNPAPALTGPLSGPSLFGEASKAMAETTELKAWARQRSGKGEARSTRREGRIPGILYGDKKEPESISVEYRAISQQLLTGHFQSTIFT